MSRDAHAASTPILYTAGYGWPFKLAALGLLVPLLAVRPNPETWRAEGWLLGAAVAALYPLALVAILETFVRKTWLTTTGIRHRSRFGRKRFIPYDDVDEFVLEADEALAIRFKNGGRLKIYAKEGRLMAIVDIARRYVGPSVRIREV